MPTTDPGPSAVRRPADLVAPLALAVLTLIVFSPALGHGWLDYDDDRNFLNNPHYRGLGLAQLRFMVTGTIMGHWTPVTWLTLGLDYVLWGMNPLGYHLGNILLHAANAAIFFVIARRLLRRRAPGRRRFGAAPRRRHRGGALRAAPAARRVGGVDHRAARRPLRVLLSARGSHVPDGGRRRRSTAPVVSHLDRALRAGAALEVDAGLAAVRAAGPRRVSAAPAGRSGLAIGDGPRAGRGEAALPGPRGGRHRVDQRRHVDERTRDAADALSAPGAAWRWPPTVSLSIRGRRWYRST